MPLKCKCIYVSLLRNCSDLCAQINQELSRWRLCQLVFLSCGNWTNKTSLCPVQVWTTESRFIIYMTVVSVMLRHTIQFWLFVVFGISLLWKRSPFVCYSELKGFGGEHEQTQPLDCLNWWYTQASVEMITLKQVPETERQTAHIQRERERVQRKRQWPSSDEHKAQTAMEECVPKSGKDHPGRDPALAVNRAISVNASQCLRHPQPKAQHSKPRSSDTVLAALARETPYQMCLEGLGEGSNTEVAHLHCSGSPRLKMVDIGLA